MFPSTLRAFFEQTQDRRTMRCSLVLGVFLLLSSTATTADQHQAQMRALRMHEYGASEVLRIEKMTAPMPKAGEVRIRVHAAGVNPIDWKVRSGRLQKNFPVPLPYIPGRDISGTIDAVGSGVSQWKVGEAVIANTDGGGFAEYAVVAEGDVARKPARLSHEEAAGIPVVSLTAWRTLIKAADVQKDQRVLIHGGAGGVGGIAVQLAHWRGAHVIATASERNHEYLKSIGADEVIDYRTTRFEDAAKNIDVVLDTVGGETLARSPIVLRQGGMLLSIAGVPSAQACGERKILCPKWAAQNPQYAGEELAKVAQLFDSGIIKMTIEAVFPLEEANKALELSETGRARGKIIVKVRD
jgi:NADPH:quinone reductase-like Zn-dependent oxidoreductase